MQGNQTIIDLLNAGLTIELTAINQYFCQAKMCRNWGFHKLADHFYHESIEEMKHAEYLIDRILYLEGVPEIARYDTIRVGDDVQEMLKYDLELERKACATYNDAIESAAKEKDAGSRDVMEKILYESEESVDWLEAQHDLIKQVGLQNYLAFQMGDQKDGD